MCGFAQARVVSQSKTIRLGLCMHSEYTILKLRPLFTRQALLWILSSPPGDASKFLSDTDASPTRHRPQAHTVIVTQSAGVGLWVCEYSHSAELATPCLRLFLS